MLSKWFVARGGGAGAGLSLGDGENQCLARQRKITSPINNMTDESTNSPESHDSLDVLLKEGDAYVPDNGFTNRVLTALPRRRRRGWLRIWVLAGAMLAGAGLADWDLPSMGALLAALPQSWSTVQWQSMLVLVPCLAAFAALIWSALALINEED
jgi:hypothetical protein